MTDHSQLVKRLEWKEWEEAPDFVARTDTAASILGEYCANENGAAYFRGVLINKPGISTINAAKAAAQADYTARILSALNLDAIEALDAERIQIAANIETIRQEVVKLRALLERKA